MDIVIQLIQHLVSTDHSIDTIDSILNRLNITRDRLLQILSDQQYADYFQLLRPKDHKKQPTTEKLALTLDVRASKKKKK